MVFTDGETFKL